MKYLYNQIKKHKENFYKLTNLVKIEKNKKLLQDLTKNISIEKFEDKFFKNLNKEIIGIKPIKKR